MKRKYLALILLTTFLVALISGCAGQNQALKSVNDMTPKEKAVWMMGVYNDQYHDYLSQAAMAEQLTPEAKEVLVKRKEILKKVWPLIKMYDGYVQTGAIPDSDIEKQIINQLNQLLTI